MTSQAKENVLAEVKRAGIIPDDLLEELTTLPPEVLNSVKLRYLLRTDMYKYGRETFMEVFDILKQKILTKTEGSTLNSEHIFDLTEILVPYAFKWRLIGTALRFQYQELDNIQAKHASEPDNLKQILVDMLGIWINTKKPTLGDLSSALGSQLVGLGLLASAIRRVVTPKRSPSDVEYYLPFDIHRVYLDLGSEQSQSEDTQLVVTAEDLLILLEVQVNPNNKSLSYQWQENGKMVQYIGSKTPFLCIPADIDSSMKEYSCRLTDAGYKRFTSTAITVSVSCPLDSFSDSLISMYLDQPEVPEDTWPPVGSKKFINLALIKQEPINYRKIFSQITIRQDLDDIPLDKEKIEYEEILDSLTSRHVLFVEGRPGCGKTTFVHKITQDWAIKVKNGYKGPLRLVLLVSLRVLNSIDEPKLDLSDILNLFKEDFEVSEDLLIKRKGKGVCFIFDGLDEFLFNNERNSIVSKIIMKEYLKCSTVIVASRPAATAPLRSRANKVVEVLGFLNKQILEYFDHYPFTDKSKIVELKKYLSDHPNVFHMCYLPIHAAMIAHLHDVTGHVPRTETEMYAHFTNLTIVRSLSKGMEVNVNDIDVHNLSSDEQKVYNDICHLAFEKTILNKQVLQQSECKFKLSQGDEDVSLGLIVVDRTAGLYRYEKIYTFLHLTFQEYLAACYISKLSTVEQCQLIQLHGSQNHMLVVWKFYCGMIKIIPGGDDRFKSILRLTAGRFLHHLQCAYESQQSLACTQVLKSMGYHIQLKNEYLSTPDFTALGYVTSKSVIPTKLSLANCNIDMEAVTAFISEIRGEGKLVKHLHFESDVVSADDIKCIQTLQKNLFLLQVLSVRALSKSDCALNLDSGFMELTKMSLSLVEFGQHCTGLCNLVTLDLTESVNNFRAIQRLAEIFQFCVNLKELDLSFNEIDDERATVLASGLKYCSNLEEITLSNNQLTKFGLNTIFCSLQQCNLKIRGNNILCCNKGVTIQCLLEILENCTSLCSLSLEVDSYVPFELYSKRWKRLKELSIHSSCITRNIELVALIGCIRNWRELQALQLSGIFIDVEEARCFASHLSCCSNLLILNLNSDHIGERQLEALSEGIKCCKNLKEIHLNYNMIKSSGARILSTCIHNNLQELHLRGTILGAGTREVVTGLARCRNLKVLDLGICNIGDAEIKVLSLCLQRCIGLEQLLLDVNDIGLKGAKSLSSCLRYCHKLVELDLSRNNIGCDGAKALAAILCHNVCLRKLDLSHNGIASNVAGALISGLKHYGVTSEALPVDVTVYILRGPSFEITVRM